MSNYTKSTNFTAKDSLPTGDTNKVIRGSEFDTEFNAISVAVATKSDLAGPTFTGTATFANLTGTGTINFTGATISSLGTVTTADINGGTIDGVTIGGSSAGAGTFSSLTATTADINAGTVDNTVIGGTTPAAGTFSSLTATTANIDGGSIDGAVIGGSTPAAISGTTGTFSGAVSGTTGTFSGAVTGSNLNVSNWDTAYGWGDHSTQGYLTSVTFSDIDAGAVTTSGETFANSDTQIPTNAAVRNWVLTTYPTIVELNDLTANVTWATVPDAYISASSVNQHVSVEKATQSKTYTLNEQSTLTLSSSITSGVPVVSVTKEVPQTGVSNNNWDVDSTNENYTRLNSAPATTLDFVGFDISAASFVDFFNIVSQDGGPQGVKFNTDGTKMFVVGNSNDSVYEYALSTAFDVSTASFSTSFSVSAQDTVPYSIAFNNDGTKMFIGGNTGDDINEYDLSTAFDISTASYSQNFSVASEDANPADIAFNSDGTVMLILGLANDSVFEYTLTTGFDLSTASYSSTSFSVASQLSIPTGMAFNSDGTKMFVVGNTTDSVFEYTLTTGFDISTASYSSVSFSVASQESSPNGITFDSIGSKMFILGITTNDAVYEYDLSSGLSLVLGTGSFASADVGKTIEANAGAFVLKATDGSVSTVTAPTSYAQVASGSWEMYAVRYNTTDGDLELSGTFFNGYDVSTASYSSTSFSVSSEDTDPRGIAFNNDGTKMYIVGDVGNDVNEYNLSTAFDISTAVYSQNFSVASQSTNPEGIFFKPDGTKMYIASESSSSIEAYNLSTAFDISTATFDNDTSTSSFETGVSGVALNNDGTKLYFVGYNTDTVYQFALSTAYDVSTRGGSAEQTFSVSSQDALPHDIVFNPDGTKMFIVGKSGQDINEYTLSTAFDISTATFVDAFSVASQETNPTAMAFNNDGSKMFVVGYDSDTVYEYNVGTRAYPSGYNAVHTTASTDSTYWTDINSMTVDEAAGTGSIYYAVSTDDRTTWKIAKGTDGERSIVRNNAGTWQYNSNGTYGSETWTNATTNTELATLQEAMEGAVGGYGISNASYDSVSFSVASQDTVPAEILFNPSGTKMYILGSTNDTVFEYDLTTAFDITTASYQRSKSVTTEDVNPQGMAFNSDGTKMYITGNINDSIFQYSLSTAYDVSTASYDSVSFSVTSQDTAPTGLAFNTDGTKMFVCGDAGDDVNEYALSTGFDISTASYTQNFSVASQETNPRHVSFKPDGTRMYIVGSGSDEVNEYELTTAFDLSTASFLRAFAMNTEDTAANGITFNADGTKMFMVGSSEDKVHQYSTPVYTNQMNKTQLDAVPDANHFTLSNDLDLAIIFNMSSGTTVPSSDGVSINFDANSLNQGAILGTDYNWDFPAANKVRITSLAAQNLKVRVL